MNCLRKSWSNSVVGFTESETERGYLWEEDHLSRHATATLEHPRQSLSSFILVMDWLFCRTGLLLLLIVFSAITGKCKPYFFVNIVYYCASFFSKIYLTNCQMYIRIFYRRWQYQDSFVLHKQWIFCYFQLLLAIYRLFSRLFFVMGGFQQSINIESESR